MMNRKKSLQKMEKFVFIKKFHDNGSFSITFHKCNNKLFECLNIKGFRKALKSIDF